MVRTVRFGAPLLALVLCVLASRAQSEELNLDFTLVNDTGWAIKEIRIAPSASNEWGANILSEEMDDDEVLKIEFHPKAKAKAWDMAITWKDGGDHVIWTNLDLEEIEKLTLRYNDETKKTTAVVE